MKKLLFAILCLLAATTYPATNAVSENDAFDILVVPSLQNGEKNWWYWVPSESGPKLSKMGPVCKEQIFNLFVIFNNYAVTEKNRAHLTYDASMLTPKGNVDFAITNALGWDKEIDPKNLIPAESVVSISVDPEDPYGEYTIKVTAYDHVASNSIAKTVTVQAVPFEMPMDIPKTEEEAGKWFFEYAGHPDPAKALAFFLNPPYSYFDENGEPIWSAVYFYKVIFEENKFLIPHMLDYFKTATEQQQKDIVLMCWLLNRMNELPELSNPVQLLAESLNEVRIPKPYEKITTGSQQDMLWAEFFATGRIKPLRQLLSSFDLVEHLGTIEKIKNKEIKRSPEVDEKAMLEAVFQAGFWSIRSNCNKSDLCFQYCIALERYGDLPEPRRHVLGMILGQVSKDKQAKAK